MLVRLKRFSYSTTETEGVLTLPSGGQFATIERPWIPNPNGALGGAPSISCIPDGLYQLEPHTSKSKGEVYIISASGLGVYRFPQDHEEDYGRDVIYMHASNWAFQLEGCVAPGLGRTPMRHKSRMQFEPAITSSGAAMTILREELGRTRSHILLITSRPGAVDGPEEN